MILVTNRRAQLLGALFSALLFLSNAVPLDARSVDPAMEIRQKLDRGEIIVGMKNVGESKYVTGSIVIKVDGVTQHVLTPNGTRTTLATPRAFESLLDD